MLKYILKKNKKKNGISNSIVNCVEILLSDMQPFISVRHPKAAHPDAASAPVEHHRESLAPPAVLYVYGLLQLQLQRVEARMTPAHPCIKTT